MYVLFHVKQVMIFNTSRHLFVVWGETAAQFINSLHKYAIHNSKARLFAVTACT